MVVAGNETTRQAMALGMLALMRFPDQLELLRSGEVDWRCAIDELIRYASPVWYFRRTATRDVSSGHTIRAGDKVVVWFGSANRDPERFPDPTGSTYAAARRARRVRPRRPPLLPRRAPRAPRADGALPGAPAAHPSMELSGPVDRLRSNFGNGVKRMPVRVELSEL